jgi:putative transposase
MDEKRERTLRRRAVRLWLQGISPRAIAKRLQRSQRWIHKWCRRYQRGVRHWAQSQSRRPHHVFCYDTRARAAVLRVRKQLTKSAVGLIGAEEVQAILREERLLPRVPSLSTIQRILHEGGLVQTAEPPAVYFPQPTGRADYILHAMDWTSRYLRGGTKVYAFHTLDLETRGLQQTLSRDKSRHAVRQHMLATWQQLGWCDGRQMDNDAAFCGGYKVPRVFGALVRLCLLVGVEPIFIPVAEPERNGAVEQVNGLWSSKFWNRHRFRNWAHVLRAKPRFDHWYGCCYHPPSLQGQTVAQVLQQAQRPHLTAQQVAALPADEELPITAGRVHFIRRVSEAGDISLLNETWHVDKRLAQHYVWATIVTHEHVLRIYHKPDTGAPVRLVKTLAYHLQEPVVALQSAFKRRASRRKMCTML